METPPPPAVHHGRPRQRRFASAAGSTAAALIGPLSPGCEIFALTGGQFSISDVILHALDQTGPARVDIATWTAAIGDIRRAETLLTSGRITTLRFVVDPSFQARKPEFCAALVRTFGPAAIRTVPCHAKFVTIRNDRWSLAIRTSMNLNPNRRLENVEVSDDPDLADFLCGYVDRLYALAGADANFTSQSKSLVETMLGGGTAAPTASGLFQPTKLPF